MITDRIVPLALTALFLFDLPLYSAETLLLPDTVVTASRIGEDSLESMSSLGVVTAEQFREQGFRTVPEALANTPGVMVQKTTHGHGSPFIRGFTGRQNLLLVDGVRINNSTYRSGPVQYWNTVDGFSMDRLELVRSQGSVQYGSDALGGTMNILTADTGYLAADPGWFQQGSAQYRFDTNSSSHVGRLQTRFGDGKNWGASLGLTGKNFGDIRDSGVGRMKNTGYPEQNLDLKVETLLNPSTRLSFAHQYLNQDNVWRWHSTIYNDTPWNNTSTGSYAARIYDQERSLTYLKVTGDLIDSPVQNYSATLSFQRSQDSAFQDRSATDVRTQVIDVDTIGLDVQLESDLLGGNLVYGIDYYRDSIESGGTRTGRDPRSRRPVADDSTYHLLGAFAQLRKPLNQRLETTFGARITHAEAELGKVWDPDNNTDISAGADWSNIVFNARALYRLDDSWNLYGGASQGFRAPNAHDLSGNITSRSGQEQLGTLDLEPEKSWTFELGSRFTSGDVSFGAAGFYTLVDDLIISVPTAPGGDTVEATNAQEAEIVGVELEAAVRFLDNLTLSGHLTWQEGDTTSPSFLGGPSEEAPVSRLSPLVASLALRYDSPDQRWWVEGRITAADKQDELSARDQRDTQRIPPGGTPSYLVASIRAGLQVSENLELTAALENITDEDYRIHGSGVNQPGINAIIGAKVSW
jgi:hemoglobin/transferrin/lactoferrin receptor protein|tara:strand:+ start:8062 stop:10146 length:2085 start_codon:yes stop_codon:yes gene_type:complete